MNINSVCDNIILFLTAKDVKNGRNPSKYRGLRFLIFIVKCVMPFELDMIDAGLTGTVRKKIRRHARLDEATDSYILSAFLVAQFGKNYQYEESNVLKGNVLMDMTIVTLKEISVRLAAELYIWSVKTSLSCCHLSANRRASEK